MLVQPISYFKPKVHTHYKLWTEICEVWPIFKGDLIEFCEILTKRTLKLYQNSLYSNAKTVKSLCLNEKSLWQRQKSVIFYLFFH